MIMPSAYSVLSSSVLGAPPRRAARIRAAAASINVTAIRFFMGPLVTRERRRRTLVFLRRCVEGRTSVTGSSTASPTARRLTMRFCFTDRE